jgi:hypothetical protein
MRRFPLGNRSVDDSASMCCSCKKTACELRCDAEMWECLEDDVARGTEHRNVQNRLPSVLTAVEEATRGRRTGRDRVQEDSTSDRDQILKSRLVPGCYTVTAAICSTNCSSPRLAASAIGQRVRSIQARFSTSPWRQSADLYATLNHAILNAAKSTRSAHPRHPTH